MTHTKNSRRIAAFVLAFALMLATATPFIGNVTGLSNTASADECIGSTC
ncbi:MAG: hypothetical protein AAF485_25100 [Chloroflexota bacterium]